MSAGIDAPKLQDLQSPIKNWGSPMRKERPWRNRRLLKEVAMPDGFKLTFWLYEWNDSVAAKLKHRFCVRIRKLNPKGLPLLTEQIGIRIDTWDTFIGEIRKLEIDGHD
jgi:hypothetical protein